MIKITKGLHLPIAGAPTQNVEAARAPTQVAVLGDDYPGMKPTMRVAVGDRVALGGVLFEDKKNPGVVYTSPAAGTVSAVHRGAKRVLQSVVIDVDASAAEAPVRGALSAEEVAGLERTAVVETLRETGLWTSLRTRPFSKVPALDSTPNSIFVTAMDTNPLAGDPTVVINEQANDFALGLDVLARLTDGAVHVCHQSGQFLPAGSAPSLATHEFDGVHPAGLPGTHIHFLDPVSADKTVWFIGYQDVIAIGVLFGQGRLDFSRVVALGGPGARQPRLLRTVLGVNVQELVAGELQEGEQRVISGSVLAGHSAEGAYSFLGRYHNQVSILPEERERELFGYLTPGSKRHSVFPTFLSKWTGEKAIDFTTTSNGSARGMVPIGTYEKVMPMDILATQLLRSLLVGDIEMAINLGCLELDEYDISLCTYACPGKYEYGPVLRDMLTQIEKEG